ncbi:MAG: hypothetical protein ACXVEE_41270 [Polyangiales bacterium]
MHRASAAMLVALVCLLAGRVRADSVRPRFGVEGSIGYLASTPDFYVNRADDAPRPFVGDRVAGGAAPLPVAFAGADLAVIYRDRWVFPLVGARVGGAFGPVPDERTTIDGSVARLRRGSTLIADVQLGGFGMRAKHRRWAYGFELLAGITVANAHGSYAYGAQELEMSATRIMPMLRGSFEVCRRIDPESRACLSASTHLYELGWLNGGVLALRWELGS